MPIILPDHRADCLAQSRGRAVGLRARDGRRAFEELRDAGEVDVAAAQDDDHPVAWNYGNVPEEESSECGGTGGLHHLLKALHRKFKAAKDLFVGKGDEAIQQ
jgi:hypothetical protein